MKNLTTFLLAFMLITMFTAFQSGDSKVVIASDVKADVITNSNGEAVVILDNATLDSLSSISGIDLSGIDPNTITSQTDLKKTLISAIGSFLTMVVMILLKYFFPSVSERLKTGNLKRKNLHS